jgi:hypothetical protein
MMSESGCPNASPVLRSTTGYAVVTPAIQRNVCDLYSCTDLRSGLAMQLGLMVVDKVQA